jgi:hypothetical protein
VLLPPLCRLPNEHGCVHLKFRSLELLDRGTSSSTGAGFTNTPRSSTNYFRSIELGAPNLDGDRAQQDAGVRVSIEGSCGSLLRCLLNVVLQPVKVNYRWRNTTGTSTAANCSGASDIFGLFRSTFGWNELFNTKAFSIGPLHNVSFELGMNAEVENNYLAPASRVVTGGLQFAFDLPYKGYFNISPLAYWEFSNHGTFATCGSGFSGAIAYPAPGATCLIDGNRVFKPTWAIETNYYMDLGFLPENMQFWSISGRASWIGPKGTEANPLPYAPGNINSVVELNAEPIRLTLDASKAIWVRDIRTSLTYGWPTATCRTNLASIITTASIAMFRWESATTPVLNPLTIPALQ